MKENASTGLEIAVIGMAGRFPGAKNIHQFWENVKNGVESVSFFSDEQLKEAGVSPRMLENPTYVKAFSVLDDVEYFDSYFFNFTPNEAEIMDPQLRIFLECSWHALEDGGYDPGTYRGSIGVYAGNGNNHYWIAKSMFNKKFHLLGHFKSSLLQTHFSTRVSYHLNLKGPGLTLQTACSTSLVAIHTACMGLLGSECDMALAGGVGIALPQVGGYIYREGGVASPDGHCRAFDAGAKGTVGGSGVGAVLLKRLDDALADGDFIYAVVKGTAINNDGLRKVGYTAPSVEGQAEAIRAAYIMAEVEPSAVGYIEAHGTGTELGDPVEVEALNMVFRGSKKASIPIGSVKTNVGHLDAAAGVTGFIKTVMTLIHRQIPPSLHFETPNPKIDFENGPFYVNTGLKEWRRDSAPLRAGVSSFGLGGTNAHAVLEEAPPRLSAGDRTARRRYLLFLLSAGTPAALESQTENLAVYLKNNPALNLADAAYTLQVGRKVFQHRRMAVLPFEQGHDMAAAIADQTVKVRSFFSRHGRRPVIFLVSGQGSQYVHMGRDLYLQETYFRETVDRCFEIVNPMVDADLKQILYPPPEDNGDNRSNGTYRTNASYSEAIHRTEITQPVVFIFEYALAKLLIKWGITPDAMIGYSMGEYVAACLSGVFSLEDALKLVTARGQLMRKTPDAAMLSVPLPEEDLLPLLHDDNRVSLAIVNGPSCIVTGTVDAVAAFESRMKGKRLLCAPINMGHAVHSPLMEPIRREFEERVGAVAVNDPRIPYISNVSGRPVTPEEAGSPVYWGKHLCNTVRFSDGIEQLLKEENAVFIEIGPGRVLSNIVRQHPAKKEEQKVVNIVKHQQEGVSDDHFLLNKIGELWLYGIPVDWAAFYGEEKRFRVPIPLYPFEKKRYWIDDAPYMQMAEMEFLPREIVDNGSAIDSPPPPAPLPYEYEGETGEYEAPRDPLEQNIARLWQDFLGFERIGINDNFFDINGDSLTATQLITRLQQIYPVEISLQRFFEYPTIAHMAEVVRRLLVERVKELSEEELEELAGNM